MKKTFAIFFALLTLAWSTSARAISYSDTVDFGDLLLTGEETYTWSHLVTPDFQIPYDTVNSASLVITSKRAAGSNDIVSVVNLGQELGTLLANGNNGNSEKLTTFDLDGLGVFSATWDSGTSLVLSLAYKTDKDNNGNDLALTLVSSVFSLDYNNVTAPPDPTNPVPEPASVILMGAGSFGLAIYGKRRRNIYHR